MRTSSSVVLSLLLLLFSTFTAAWPWPKWLPEIDSLVVRQNSDGDASTPAASQTPSPSATSGQRPSNSGSATITNALSTNTQSGQQTGSATGSNNGSGSNTRATATKARTTSYDQRLPAGGVAMITPSVFDGEQYFKVGDFVTFAWNYTSLLASPTAVNILATCKANNQMYTLAVNQTIQANATQSIVWDTGNYQKTALSDPLLTEKYTLIIYDADSAITDVPRAGYLAPFAQYVFGMYTPQPYVSKEQYVCVTCSAAFGDMERRMMGMVFGMSALTVLSFTWFVGGSGVIW